MGESAKQILPLTKILKGVEKSYDKGLKILNASESSWSKPNCKKSG
jgi:hypothetical protein